MARRFCRQTNNNALHRIIQYKRMSVPHEQTNTIDSQSAGLLAECMQRIANTIMCALTFQNPFDAIHYRRFYITLLWVRTNNAGLKTAAVGADNNWCRSRTLRTISVVCLLMCLRPQTVKLGGGAAGRIGERVLQLHVMHVYIFDHCEILWMVRLFRSVH